MKEADRINKAQRKKAAMQTHILAILENIDRMVSLSIGKQIEGNPEMPRMTVEIINMLSKPDSDITIHAFSIAGHGYRASLVIRYNPTDTQGIQHHTDIASDHRTFSSATIARIQYAISLRYGLHWATTHEKIRCAIEGTIVEGAQRGKGVTV